uniref:Ig-like domain-containing protein n=1 Tax=Esox lucius TaxID=8010 RepID=A0AAY5L4A2_ESOLU
VLGSKGLEIDFLPVENEVTSTEGHSVTLNCTYTTSSPGPLLYWYRHFSNQAPTFMLFEGAKSMSGYGKIADKRYKSTTSDTSTELVIQQLTLSDTGFYYCAVDTVIQSSTAWCCSKEINLKGANTINNLESEDTDMPFRQTPPHVLLLNTVQNNMKHQE